MSDGVQPGQERSALLGGRASAPVVQAWSSRIGPLPTHPRPVVVLRAFGSGGGNPFFAGFFKFS